MADAWEMDWLGIAGVIQRLITDERVSGVPVWRPRLNTAEATSGLVRGEIKMEPI